MEPTDIHESVAAEEDDPTRSGQTEQRDNGQHGKDVSARHAVLSWHCSSLPDRSEHPVTKELSNRSRQEAALLFGRRVHFNNPANTYVG